MVRRGSSYFSPTTGAVQLTIVRSAYPFLDAVTSVQSSIGGTFGDETPSDSEGGAY